MFDRLDPRSPTPLYAQISTRIRMAIAAGELAGGATLPSVRQLAAQLRVNPATVVQAYRELEGEGLVATRQGAGTTVLEIAGERKSQERRAAARRLVRELLADGARVGLTAAEIQDALQDEIGRGGGR